MKLFSPAEIELLQKAERTNSDELLYWRMPNVIYPFIVVLVSLLAYCFFKPADKFSWLGLINLIFNGSLPMVALNRMSSIGSNLFKYDKSKEKNANRSTTALRVKIDDYSKILLIAIAFLYIFQVINGPFGWTWWFIVQLILSIIFIRVSLSFSKYAYLLQERLMERTIGDEIMDSAKENKNHLAEKYGG